MLDNYYLYIDPGVGSAIAVMILSAATGVGMFLKIRWNKLVQIWNPVSTDIGNFRYICSLYP